MKHIFSCRVKDKPGVLTRIAASFSEKGLNIQSLSVAVTEGYEETRTTLVVQGESEKDIQEITDHLNSLEDIIEVEDFAGKEYLAKELALIKIKAPPREIPHITQLLELFDAPIVDMGKSSLTVEFSGPDNKVTALIKMLDQFGIKEVTRTGMVALKTGD
mgnify:CR=1 FL=1